MNEGCKVADMPKTSKERPLYILVVDDNEAMATVIGHFLDEEFNVQRKKDTTIFILQDGSKLEDFLLGHKKPLDLVIMDWNMSGQNGWNTYKQLRSEASYKSTPVLFNSSDNEVATFIELQKEQDSNISFIYKDASTEYTQKFLEAVRSFLPK